MASYYSYDDIDDPDKVKKKLQDLQTRNAATPPNFFQRFLQGAEDSLPRPLANLVNLVPSGKRDLAEAIGRLQKLQGSEQKETDYENRSALAQANLEGTQTGNAIDLFKLGQAKQAAPYQQQALAREDALAGMEYNAAKPADMTDEQWEAYNQAKGIVAPSYSTPAAAANTPTTSPWPQTGTPAAQNGQSHLTHLLTTIGRKNLVPIGAHGLFDPQNGAVIGAPDPDDADEPGRGRQPKADQDKPNYSVLSDDDLDSLKLVEFEKGKTGAAEEQARRRKANPPQPAAPPPTVSLQRRPWWNLTGSDKQVTNAPPATADLGQQQLTDEQAATYKKARQSGKSIQEALAIAQGQ